MKNVCLIFLITTTLLTNSFAATKSKCSGIDQEGFPDEYRACIRLELAEKASDAGVDCVECMMHEKEQQGPSDWVLALGAIAQPLAYLGAAYVTADYQNKSQQAWADAYSNAANQCTNRFNSYLNYTTTMGANPITTDQASALNSTCNGSSYNTYSGYAGYVGNGLGGYGNPMLQAGYSGGFMGGMIGPNFGGANMSAYGMGMMGGAYPGLSGSIYGGIGMSASPFALNYSAPGGGYYGAGMMNGGMGINTMYTGYTSGGIVPYAAGNLSANLSVTGGVHSGFAF